MDICGYVYQVVHIILWVLRFVWGYTQQYTVHENEAEKKKTEKEEEKQAQRKYAEASVGVACYRFALCDIFSCVDVCFCLVSQAYDGISLHERYCCELFATRLFVG